MLYHGTDLENAKKICKNGFRWKQNDEHWLGNGVYFYLDRDLAEWWTTNPSKIFGTEIKVPCILSAEVSIKDERVLDLRNLQDYRECLLAYNEFEELALSELKTDVAHNIKKLRCAFFDWVFGEYEIDCIIGCFSHANKKYLIGESPKILKQFELFSLNYIETQVCMAPHLVVTNLKMHQVEKGGV